MPDNSLTLSTFHTLGCTQRNTLTSVNDWRIVSCRAYKNSRDCVEGDMPPPARGCLSKRGGGRRNTVPAVLYESGLFLPLSARFKEKLVHLLLIDV